MRVCKCVSVCAHARVWSPKISWTTDFFFFKKFDFCFLKQQKFFVADNQSQSSWSRGMNSMQIFFCFDELFSIIRRNYCDRSIFPPLLFHPFLHPPPTLKRIHLNYFHFLIKIFLRLQSASSVCLQYFLLWWVRRVLMVHGLFVALDEIRWKCKFRFRPLGALVLQSSAKLIELLSNFVQNVPFEPVLTCCTSLGGSKKHKKRVNLHKWWSVY